MPSSLPRSAILTLTLNLALNLTLTLNVTLTHTHTLTLNLTLNLNVTLTLSLRQVGQSACDVPSSWLCSATQCWRLSNAPASRA